MAQKYIIDAFQPPSFHKAPLNIKRITALMKHTVQYAAMGRYALYHILKSLQVQDKILIPAYICPSVIDPLRLLNITPIFYDIDTADLNANHTSIAFLAEKYNVKAVLIASMYGNPADLESIEQLCKSRDIILIDDAAQSFGAKLNDRYIGSFGDAGFFSFSPGKPTAGHMGSFFWTRNNEYHIARTRHSLYHRINYLDFYLNRLHRDRYKKLLVGGMITSFKKMFSCFTNITNDDIEPFEQKILGGMLYELLNHQFNFRVIYFNEFIDQCGQLSWGKIIVAQRGIPHPHKIILVTETQNIAKKLMQCLKDNGIFSLGGYPLPCHNKKLLPNARSIEGKVVELPIENNHKKMQYLYSVVNKF